MPPPLTLHDSELLAQTTVLVLGGGKAAPRAMRPNDFLISLDSGHPVHPRNVRVEGTEPIDLSLLIDVGQPNATLDPTVDKAIADVFSTDLPPGSHVSIFVLGCVLTRTLDAAPPEAASIESAVDRGLATRRAQQSTSLATPANPPACAHPVGLRDALIFVTESASQRSGHRVLLAISPGTDRSSARTWDELRSVASLSSAAIFGLPGLSRDRPSSNTSPDLADKHKRFTGFGTTNPFDQPRPGLSVILGHEDQFSLLCQLTGGVRFSTGESRLPASQPLSDFITVVRRRYVIDFHVSNDITQGRHGLTVKMADDRKLLAFASGLSISTAALQEQDSPSDTDASLAPGNRRILSPTELDKGPQAPPK